MMPLKFASENVHGLGIISDATGVRRARKKDVCLIGRHCGRMASKWERSPDEARRIV